MDIYSRTAWWAGVAGILTMLALAAFLLYPLVLVEPASAGDVARSLFPGNYGAV